MGGGGGIDGTLEEASSLLDWVDSKRTWTSEGRHRKAIVPTTGRLKAAVGGVAPTTGRLKEADAKPRIPQSAGCERIRLCVPKALVGAWGRSNDIENVPTAWRAGDGAARNMANGANSAAAPRWAMARHRWGSSGERRARGRRAEWALSGSDETRLGREKGAKSNLHRTDKVVSPDEERSVLIRFGGTARKIDTCKIKVQLWLTDSRPSPPDFHKTSSIQPSRRHQQKLAQHGQRNEEE